MIHKICSEIVARILNDEEWEKLTLAWYAKKQWSNEVYASDEIFEWEKNALNFFPPAPSNLLVLAAGQGREMRALIAMGYSVFGIEMDKDCVGMIRNSCRPEKLLGVVCASFLDIVTGKHKLPAIPIAGVVVGWGALVNLPSKEVLVELIRLLAKCYPQTPLLLSGSMAYQPRPIKSYFPSNPLSSVKDRSDFYRWFDQGCGPCGHLKVEVLEGIFNSCGYKLLHRSRESEYPHWIIS